MSNAISRRAQIILNDLESTRGNLTELRDDIWLSIDNSDNDAVKQGTEFHLAYNTQLGSFEEIASELSAMVQQFMGIHTEVQIIETTVSDDSPTGQRIVKELDRSQAHSLNEVFVYKRPCAFRLKDKVYTGVRTWRRLYEKVLSLLAGMDPELFKGLPENPRFKTTHGNQYFVREPGGVHTSLELHDGVYAWVCLSATQVRNRIKRLLVTFGIAEDEFVVYLREDRDAGRAAEALTSDTSEMSEEELLDF